jgi:Protein of unknown function (DUF1203)
VPTTATFQIRPLPAAALDAVRRSGVDAAGTPTITLIATGAEPLRCCRRDARAGEALILFGYEPPLPGAASPYREVGAIFAHADQCTGAGASDSYPQDWQDRPQVLRAYDERGWIHPATTTHDGSDPVAAIAKVLTEPGVVEVHSRNVAYGCFRAQGRCFYILEESYAPSMIYVAAAL